MTNWKDDDTRKHKTKKKEKDKDKSKEKDKPKSEAEWKKVSNATKAVGRIKASYRRKTHTNNSDSPDRSRQTSVSDAAEVASVQEQKEVESLEKVTEDQNDAVESVPEVQTTEEKQEVQTVSEGKSKKHGGKQGKSKRQTTKAEELVKEKDPAQVEDPETVLKNKVFQVIKNAFSLAYTDDEELRINVDNIYPLLKALGLNPQSEIVMDLVRDACMESTGDIDPKDFESVVMTLIKEKDDDLWLGRLEEKQFLFWEAEDKKKKLEAERERLEQERAKAGFEKEDENVDEWEEYERQKKEEADKKEHELKEDELYDNLKMAFRFIDADGDGVISTKDVYTLMMGVGEMVDDDELFGMVNMADVDCDGKVTFDDFKNFLNPGQADEQKPTKTPEPLKPEDDTSKPVENDDTVTPEQKIPEASPKPEEPAKPQEPELSQEEQERRKRRRQSMLMGYMNVAKVVASVEETKSTEPKLTEEGEEEMNKDSEGTPDVRIDDTTVNEDMDKSNEDNKCEENDKPEQGSFLDAIREEDEHSNYDMEQAVPSNSKLENKISNAGDNKRKLFSRQSSAASLKNKQNSSVTESIDDSGIGTIETNYGSEIREQPDTFDISDEENESTKRTAAKERRSRSRQDIYQTDDDDEDMIEARHVHESLSRVSSMDSLVDNLKDVEDDSTDVSDERTRNFVEQHMYVEVEPVIEDTDEMLLEQERLKKADLLQKAILRRSSTSPNLTVFKSRLQRPHTAKPSVNGYTCSHIDINLTCDSPPRADIKSMKRFAERIRSAKEPDATYDKAFLGRQMSVVDLSEVMNRNENLPTPRELTKFPSRPLTRPRSPTQKRVSSAKNRQLKPMDTKENIATHKPERTRAKSAVPFLRETTKRPVTPRRIIKRPLTAQIPYTGSKRMEKEYAKFEKKDNLTLVVSEPFLNSDELYPNKTMFTAQHHGFKSIWPIGRKINLIRDKRPFSAFEMNSYSRSIERNEFPFKRDIFNDTAVAPNNEQVIPERELRIVPTRKTLIKLELDTDGVRKPVIKKISTLVNTAVSSPRTVR